MSLRRLAPSAFLLVLDRLRFLLSQAAAVGPRVAVGLAVPEGIGSLKQAVLISSPLTLEQARTRSPLVVAVRQGLGLPVRTVVTPVQ